MLATPMPSSDTSETLVGLLRAQVAADAEFQVFIDLGVTPADPNSWRRFTWADVWKQSTRLAEYARRKGISVGDRICILASNRPEHAIAEYAAQLLGAISVSLYPNLSDTQMKNVLTVAEPAMLVAEDNNALSRLKDAVAIRPRCAVQFDDEASWSRIVQDGALDGAGLQGPPNSDCISTILFTSGTTGASKGVILTHRNLVSEAQALLEANLFPANDRHISYLPFAHVIERVWSFYAPLVHKRQVCFLRNATDLPLALVAVRPTYFFGTPRVWEKLAGSIRANLAARGSNVLEAIDRSIADVAEKRQPDAQLIESLAPMRKAIGLDECPVRGVGAAYLSPHIAHFFSAVGLSLSEGYGLSECSGIATLNTPKNCEAGTVGEPLPGVAVKIASDGEVLLQGAVCSPGYYRNAEASRSLYTDDRWMRTGDLGTLTVEGRLVITGRKKDLIITSSGKNIPPDKIEAALSDHAFIEHALLIGEGRPYLVALLVLSEAGRSRALADVEASVNAHVQRINNTLSRNEQIKRFKLIADRWSIEGGQLTPTMKLKRLLVTQQYSDEAERLYSIGVHQ